MMGLQGVYANIHSGLEPGFFFFQAEDGIRDVAVTGVQTCALPISGLFAYFGIGGAIAYLHGSRAAPADPVACGIGIVGGVWFGFLGLRLITGWHEDRQIGRASCRERV